MDEALPNLTGYINHPGGGSGRTEGSIVFRRTANFNCTVNNRAEFNGEVLLNASNQSSVFKDGWEHVSPLSLGVRVLIKY